MCTAPLRAVSSILRALDTHERCTLVVIRCANRDFLGERKDVVHESSTTTTILRRTAIRGPLFVRTHDQKVSRHLVARSILSVSGKLGQPICVTNNRLGTRPRNTQHKTIQHDTMQYHTTPQKTIRNEAMAHTHQTQNKKNKTHTQQDMTRQVIQRRVVNKQQDNATHDQTQQRRKPLCSLRTHGSHASRPLCLSFLNWDCSPQAIELGRELGIMTDAVASNQPCGPCSSSTSALGRRCGEVGLALAREGPDTWKTLSGKSVARTAFVQTRPSLTSCLPSVQSGGCQAWVCIDQFWMRIQL